ncbi:MULTISPECIES: 2-keto-4-pentenoate hydratase [Sphingomonadales]|uniref:4-oxalocrotonate decarboxylase n=1 Tax=Croceicoccus pelagius TaxID=1703341 RepID=A0A917DPC4_9SPHN|nr:MULTISPECIES: fumarylacetoacetate hydrolase family protein [Sphingomonadales]PEQ10920.1 4-oxalocrotonate decarboxylase [Novosphingobium sp. PC22D]GGD53814.1 4-oxalocrotonate decarboxylase [Croceicoccus pelagius]
MDRLARYAETLDTAAREANATPQITPVDTEFSVTEAYQVQKLSVDRRLSRGERRIGVKMGLTSRAKMQQVGVDEVAWGRLTDAMLIEEGSAMSRARYVHPRVEPEVAFLMKAPLVGKVTAAAALAAVEAIAPAMEIIDSRYENFKFALEDVIADNTSSSGLVIGSWHDPRIDFSNLGVILEIDGEVVQVGSTAAILGHPIRSLVAAARLVAESGEQINAGDIVMAGGITAAPNLAPGQTVRTTVQNLGAVMFQVED